MNEEVKTLWLEALRSGEYTQGEFRLKTDLAAGEVQFCCLGVLCEIAVKEGVISKYNGERGGTPDKVAKWAGLPLSRTGRKNVQQELAKKNDGVYSWPVWEGQHNFEELAHWIEENL